MVVAQSLSLAQDSTNFHRTEYILIFLEDFEDTTPFEFADSFRVMV